MKLGPLQLGDVIVDPDLRTLSFSDGRPAPLRHKSREVLFFLLENQNHTVTKEALLSSVWTDVTVSEESLVQCVADIRRVIGKDAHRLVETIPRQGYRVNLRTPRRPNQPYWLGAALATGTIAICILGLLFSLDLNPLANRPSDPAISATERDPPGTASTEAYLEVLKGRVSANRFSLQESLTAERHFRRAIELDPNYARAYGELATLLAIRFENDWTVLEKADKQKALFYAETAVTHNPDLWLAHYALGRLHSLFGDLEAAEASLETAMTLRPDYEDARAYLGVVRNFQGNAEGAAAIFQQAIASHPNPPYWYYFGLGHAQFNLRRYVEAEDSLKTCLSLAGDSPYCLRYLLGVYGATGNSAKATHTAKLYASTGFEPSVASILNLMSFHHADDLDQLEWALRQTGIAD